MHDHLTYASQLNKISVYIAGGFTPNILAVFAKLSSSFVAVIGAIGGCCWYTVAAAAVVGVIVVCYHLYDGGAHAHQHRQ